MSYNVINPYQTFRDSTGAVRAGGFITFYENKTTTAASIYSDELLTVAQSNPYTLDAYGRIAGDVKYTGALTLKIQNSDLSDIFTIDDVTTIEGSAAITAATKAAAAALSFTSLDAGRKLFVTSADGGEFTIRYNATPGTYSDNGGSYCGTVFIPAGGDGTIGIERDFLGYYNVKWFGMALDGTTDDSAALQQASTTVKALGGGNLYFPPSSSKAQVNSVTIGQHVGLIGDVENMSQLQYNGAGGSGSYVIKFESQSFSNFQNMGILANNSDGVTFADNCVRMTSTLDLLVDWNNLQFAHSTYNAIYCESTVALVNWSLDKVRFDGIGGYGIRMVTLAGSDSRPLRITNFTYDNTPHAGRSSPANWGLGVLRIIQQSHVATPIRLEADSARIEINTPLVTTTYGDFTTGEEVSLFYLEHASGAGNEYPVDFSNIFVNNLATGQSLVHSDGGTPHGTYRNISVSGGAYVMKDFASATRDASFKGSVSHHVVYAPSNTGQSGCAVTKTTALALAASTWTDFIFNSSQDNQRSEYSTSTGVFTCDSAGVYNMYAQYRLDGVADAKDVQIKFQIDTGAGYSDLAISGIVTAKASQAAFASISKRIYLEFGYKIKVQVFHNDAGSLNTAANGLYNHIAISRDS